MPCAKEAAILYLLTTACLFALATGMKLGDLMPDFACTTDRGTIDSFHAWIGEGNWAILFSHPADFTPVCTTELARAAQLAGEFARRRVRMIALSCDSAEAHRGWIKDIAAYANTDSVNASSFPFEIIADESRQLATQLEMLDPLELDKAGLPLTARAVFVVGPDRTLRSLILYPATTGRSFDEILRLIDSLQLTAKHPVATPEGWVNGGDCMVQPWLSEGDACAKFGSRWHTREMPSGKKYMRFTGQPVEYPPEVQAFVDENRAAIRAQEEARLHQ